MHSSLKRQLFKTFAQMVADLKTGQEAEKFLTDFFSDSELEKFTKRISIAYWLKKGRDRDNIQQNLLASALEIKIAGQILSKEGVKLAIKKIEAEEWANQWADRIQKITSRK